MIVKNTNEAQPGEPISRRRFLKAGGLTVIATGLGSALVACGTDAPVSSIGPTNQAAIVPGPNQTTGAIPALPGQSVAPVSPVQPSQTTAPVKLGNPLDTATAYLTAWNQGKYAEMYSYLSTNSRNFIAQDKFIERYVNIAAEATISNVQAQLGPTAVPPLPGLLTTAIPFKVTFKTARVGDFSQDNQLHLAVDNNAWKIDWTAAAIFKELDNTTYLVRMVPYNPTRGEILTADGQPLTAPTPLYQIYVVPGQIENEEALLTNLSPLVGFDKEKIKNLYKSGQPDWRMPIKNLPSATTPDTIDKLRQIKGVGVDETNTRGYPQGQTASQVVGYVNAVNADDLKTLTAKGYTEEDLIGRTGVEAWGEELLAGTFGGLLTVVRRDGTTSATLMERQAAPPANLVLNLNLNIQRQAEVLLAERVGSIVVLDPANGGVLALASFPRYDPNLFINGITADQLKALNDDKRRPFQNRAVNGVLPTGSTFKVITMAAALEKAGVTPQTRYTCTGHWSGLGNQFVKDCWNKSGHGSISVLDGLTQSCDVVFYELGKKLDEIDPNILPTFARGFGLGNPTGLIGLYDSPGQVPDPKWKQEKLSQPWVRGDAVNLAIGQGYLLATPLQLALVYAAIANNGDQPVPRLVDRAENNGAVVKAFTSQMKARLPVSDASLAAIRQGLLNVTQSGAGTARAYFAGAKVRVAGKTGTAESGQEQPHSWFACYAPVEQPKYVVVVLLENYGENKPDAAGPTARKMIDFLPF